MKELLEEFDGNQIRRIRDWFNDEVQMGKSCAETVRNSLIDESGGILDDRGRKRLLLGIFALHALADTEDFAIVDLRTNRMLCGISIFKLGSDSDLYLEFYFTEC